MGPRVEELHEGRPRQGRVGDAAQEDVLPRDAARGAREVLATRRHHLRDPEQAVGGHDGAPGDVVGGVQGDGQVDRDALLRQPADARHQPHRGDGHVPEAQARPLGGVGGPEERDHLVVVVQRLPHAHHHQPRDPARRGLAGGRQELRHDLPGGERTDEPGVPAGTEAAPLAAAHLGAEADAVAVPVRQQDRLHALAVGQRPQQLDGAAVAPLALHQPGAVHHRRRLELAPQPERQVRHLVKAGDEPLVYPRHHLPGPVRRLAQFLEEPLPLLGQFQIQKGCHGATSMLARCCCPR